MTILAFVLGVLAGAFLPDGVRDWARSLFRPRPNIPIPETLQGLLFGARGAPSPHQAAPAVVSKILGGGARVVSFLWRYKWALLVIALFFFGVSVLRGCSPNLGKSRDVLVLEARLAQAESETQTVVNARNAIIAQAAQEAAVHRAQIGLLLEQGHHEIEAATPSDDRPIDAGLEFAWRTSLERLRLYPADNADSPHSGGSSA